MKRIMAFVDIKKTYDSVLPQFSVFALKLSGSVEADHKDSAEHVRTGNNSNQNLMSEQDSRHKED